MADRNGYIGRAPSDSSVTVARQTFSPTGVTTDFTFASGYTPGYFDIFINGVKMIEGSDYTSTDGSTFSVLNGGVVSGDVIDDIDYHLRSKSLITDHVKHYPYEEGANMYVAKYICDDRTNWGFV